MRRCVVALVAVTMMGALAVAPTFALTKPQVFSLLDVSGPSTAIPPGSFNPNANEPIPAGGRFTVSDTLYKWAGRKRGARVGRLDGFCTATKLDLAARSETVFCNVTAYLPAGQILLAGQLVFSDKTTSFQVVVTGGTGGYAGVRGYVKVTNLGNSNNSNDEFHLLP